MLNSEYTYGATHRNSQDVAICLPLFQFFFSMKTKLIMKLLNVTGLIIWTVRAMSGPFTAEARTSMWANIIQKKVFRGFNRPGSQYDSFTWILSYTTLILYSEASSFSSSFWWFNPRDPSRMREIKTSIELVGRKTGSFKEVQSYQHRKPQPYITIQLRAGFELVILVFRRFIHEIRHIGCNSFITDILGPISIGVFMAF